MWKEFDFLSCAFSLAIEPNKNDIADQKQPMAHAHGFIKESMFNISKLLSLIDGSVFSPAFDRYQCACYLYQQVGIWYSSVGDFHSRCVLCVLLALTSHFVIYIYIYYLFGFIAKLVECHTWDRGCDWLITPCSARPQLTERGYFTKWLHHLSDMFINLTCMARFIKK